MIDEVHRVLVTPESGERQGLHIGGDGMTNKGCTVSEFTMMRCGRATDFSLRACVTITRRCRNFGLPFHFEAIDRVVGVDLSKDMLGNMPDSPMPKL